MHYHGFDLSPHGQLNILFVFAEVDCNTCTPGTPLSTNDVCTGNSNWSTWQTAEWKRGELPTAADDWTDFDPSQTPSRFITKFYDEVSFGDLRILGDYYPSVLTVPCDKLTGNTFDPQVQAVIAQLNEEYTNNNPDFLTTARGMYNLQNFDLISNERQRGQVKPAQSNNEIDAICLIWRNYKVASAYAFQNFGGGTILNDPNLPSPGNQFEVFLTSSWLDYSGNFFELFIAEIFHPMYGGNNWHTGGGADEHTFPFNPSNISITGQHPSSSQAVCGWDRLMMGWTSPIFNPVAIDIPVLDDVNNLTSGELAVENINPGITEQIFILRDHFTTGDALRIKLPHIIAPVKNQYLWVENRQLISEFDIQKPDDLGCLDSWVPGLYPYIQVGKDLQCSNSQFDLYSSFNHANANALGSYLFPLSAEGNFDYHYREDLKNNTNSNHCAGHQYIPKEINHINTLANPFTGASDLYMTLYDGNDNGFIGRDAPGGSTQQDIGYDIGNAEIINGVLELTKSYHGDGDDAFRLLGNHRIGIGTNPSATPVYTRTSGPDSEEYNANAIMDYENRTIWLNGISVEILEEIPNPSFIRQDGTVANDLKVRVKWDDYVVRQNNRWCGDIVLQDDPNDSWQSQLIIDEDTEIVLD